MENLRDNIVDKISFDIFGNMNLNLYKCKAENP